MTRAEFDRPNNRLHLSFEVTLHEVTRPITNPLIIPHILALNPEEAMPFLQTRAVRSVPFTFRVTLPCRPIFLGREAMRACPALVRRENRADVPEVTIRWDGAMRGLYETQRARA